MILYLPIATASYAAVLGTTEGVARRWLRLGRRGFWALWPVSVSWH